MAKRHGWFFTKEAANLLTILIINFIYNDKKICYTSFQKEKFPKQEGAV